MRQCAHHVQGAARPVELKNEGNRRRWIGKVTQPQHGCKGQWLLSIDVRIK